MITIVFKGFKHGDFKFIDVPEQDANEIITYVCDKMDKQKKERQTKLSTDFKMRI